MAGVTPATVEVMTMAISDHSEGPAGPSAAAQFDKAREDSAAAIRAIAKLLEPDQEGLRPVTREGVEAVKASVEEHGLLRQFPVMRDTTLLVECKSSAPAQGGLNQEGVDGGQSGLAIERGIEFG
jgi:hypothetical protein